MTELRTPRVMLRQWREADFEPFATLNADPEVMRHFSARFGRAQSDALAERERARIDDQGWGLWALEVVDRAPFVGFVGLSEPSFKPTSPLQSRSAGGSRAKAGATGMRRGRSRSHCVRLRRAGPRRDRLLHDGWQRALRGG